MLARFVRPGRPPPPARSSAGAAGAIRVRHDGEGGRGARASCPVIEARGGRPGPPVLRTPGSFRAVLSLSRRSMPAVQSISGRGLPVERHIRLPGTVLDGRGVILGARGSEEAECRMGQRAVGSSAAWPEEQGPFGERGSLPCDTRIRVCKLQASEPHDFT